MSDLTEFGTCANLATVPRKEGPAPRSSFFQQSPVGIRLSAHVAATRAQPLSRALCLDTVPDHGGYVGAAQASDGANAGRRGHVDLGEVAIDHVDAGERETAL